MATITLTICDVCPPPDQSPLEGRARTTRLSLDGASYELDLCASHLTALQEQVMTYAERGRRTGQEVAPVRRRKKAVA